jgi:phospholipid N-methyltransferase
MDKAREDPKDNLRRRALFLRSMISNPREVGAVWPTSRWAVRDLLDMGDLTRARTVVEFGVGTGVYTEEVLKRLHPEATFLAFEIDPDLASAVDARLQDPRLRVINDSAENVEAYLEGAKADYIVSSVPFTSLPTDVRRSLLEAARRALAPDGQMLVLQYSTAVLPYLESIFPTIRRRFSPLNVPPAFLFACSVSDTLGERAEEAPREGLAEKTSYVLTSLALGALLFLLGRKLGRR